MPEAKGIPLSGDSPMTQVASIPMLDLKAQYASIRDEIRAAIDSVLDSQHFILGPQVKALEGSLVASSAALRPMKFRDRLAPNCRWACRSPSMASVAAKPAISRRMIQPSWRRTSPQSAGRWSSVIGEASAGRLELAPD